MRAKAHVWVAVGALGLLSGCANRDVQAYQVIKSSPSIASQYRCAPNPQLGAGYFGFHYEPDENSLWISDPRGLAKLSAKSGADSRHFYMGRPMSTITSDRAGYFAVTELAASWYANAYLFQDGVASSVAVGGSDWFTVQFSEDSERWYAQCWGELRRKSIDASMKIDRPTLSFEHVDLLPGAYGRLMRAHKSGSIRWLDAEAGLFLGDPVLQKIPDDAKVWVDQGHVLYEAAGTIRDAGCLSTLSNISSKKEAFGFSPWNLSRTEDKLTLIATAIFADGPVVTLKRASEWRQETIAYGFHAVVSTNELQNPIEFYDLRKGKLVATLKRSSENPLDFLLQFTDGVFCGTDGMIQAAKLDPKEANRYQALRRLQDLLQMKR